MVETAWALKVIRMNHKGTISLYIETRNSKPTSPIITMGRLVAQLKVPITAAKKSLPYEVKKKVVPECFYVLSPGRDKTSQSYETVTQVEGKVIHYLRILYEISFLYLSPLFSIF